MSPEQIPLPAAASPRSARPPTVDDILAEREGARGGGGDEVAAATRPAGAAAYAPWRRVWLPIPLLLLLLDVLFPVYFWRIPKLTGGADDYSYQLLYNLHHMQEAPPDGVRVLAFGSSVAVAFDPHQVRGLLETALPGQSIDVQRLMQPGIKPSDFRVMLPELERIDAPVVVALFNLVDFLNPSFERSLKPGIRAVLPPWQTLRTRYEYVPAIADRLELLVASASNLYRYRKLIRSSLRDHAKLVRSWWRTGDASAPYGVYPDGFTAPRFGVPAAAAIEYDVDPAWIEQRGRARVAFYQHGRRVGGGEHLVPGRFRVILDITGDVSGIVDGVVEGGWSPRAAGNDDDLRLLGVRLAAAASSTISGRGSPPVRYPPVEPTEIKPFLRMGGRRGAAYADTWREMLAADSNFALRYRLYHEAKMECAAQPFVADGEFLEFRRLIDQLVAGGRRVVLVNTPESPLLAELVHSPFFRGFVEFFSAIAAADSRITFLDLHDLLPAEDLNDWHHVNFVGQVKVGMTVARALQPVVGLAIAERAGGR